MYKKKDGMGSSFKNMMVFTLWVLIIMWLGLRLFDELMFRIYRPYASHSMQQEQCAERPVTQRELREGLDSLAQRIEKLMEGKK